MTAELLVYSYSVVALKGRHKTSVCSVAYAVGFFKQTIGKVGNSIICLWADNFCLQQWKNYYKKLSCRREAVQCFVFVCNQLQHTYRAFFLLPVIAASDLLVHKILLWLGYPMVKKFRRYLYSFWRNSRTWQTHRQTDGQTPHDSISRAYASHRAAKTSSASCEFQFIRGFYVSISIQNILKGNIQLKFKGASVWPKSTAVITWVIFTCPGRPGPVFRLDRGLTYFAHRCELHSTQWSHILAQNHDLRMAVL